LKTLDNAFYDDKLKTDHSLQKFIVKLQNVLNPIATFNPKMIDMLADGLKQFRDNALVISTLEIRKGSYNSSDILSKIDIPKTLIDVADLESISNCLYPNWTELVSQCHSISFNPRAAQILLYMVASFYRDSVFLKNVEQAYKRYLFYAEIIKKEIGIDIISCSKRSHSSKSSSTRNIDDDDNDSDDSRSLRSVNSSVQTPLPVPVPVPAQNSNQNGKSRK
jgi:hypothetical protein